MLQICTLFLLAVLGLLAGCNNPAASVRASSGPHRIHILGTAPDDVPPTGSTQGKGPMSDD